jgi:hypothetical protein
MADRLDLTGTIAAGIDGAAARGHAVVIGYIDDDGYAAVSFRGSTQVHSATQLAFWARKTSDGIVTAIAQRPQVTFLFYEVDGPGPRYLSIRGRAHVDPSANDAVYDHMIEGEQKQDPDRHGVAVIIDVESVRGFADGAPLQMSAEDTSAS